MLLAAVVAGLRHAALPFTGAAPPKGLGIAGSGDAIAVAEALVRALAVAPALLLEAVVLAAAAVAIRTSARVAPGGSPGSAPP